MTTAFAATRQRVLAVLGALSMYRLVLFALIALAVTAFVLSAAFAGVAGGMYTLFTSFIHPEGLGFQTTILILTMVVVGGLGSVRGAVAGAIVFGLASELLRQAPSYQEIIYGGILMLFMMFLPKGMASLFAARRKPQRAASVAVTEKHA